MAAPGVLQGLVHRDDLHHRGDGQPRGGDPARPEPPRPHQAEVFPDQRRVRTQRGRHRFATLRLQVIRRHITL